LNYNQIKAFIKLLSITLIISLALNSAAQRTKSSQSAGEQRYAEKGLKDSRYFFYFINSAITNFGTKEEQQIYKEAIQRDMIAQLMYMKFKFHDSFVEIKRSQALLVKVYRMVLTRDIKKTKSLLNNFAAEAINSKNSKPRHYLKLGYRDVAVANQYLIMANHYRSTLYSMILYKYVEALKMAKHGKRYAFFSIIKSRGYEEKKIKRRGPMKFVVYEQLGNLSFKNMMKLVKGITKDKNNQDYYIKIHYDNYYKFHSKKSFFDLTWENPKLDEIPQYKEYIKKS